MHQFVGGFLTGWFLLGAPWLIRRYFEMQREDKKAAQERINRKAAYDREVAEGRMETDGKGTYWQTSYIEYETGERMSDIADEIDQVTAEGYMMQDQLAKGKYVALRGLEARNKFFCFNKSEEPTKLADGTVAYEVIGYANTIQEAQMLVLGRVYDTTIQEDER